KAGERGAHQAMRIKKCSSRWCFKRASRGLLGNRRKLRGVATKPRAAMRLSRRVDDGPSMKIGVYSSPSRIASGPILATLGIRALLAPNFRSRLTCCEEPNPFEDLRLPYFSPEQRFLLSPVSAASRSIRISYAVRLLVPSASLQEMTRSIRAQECGRIGKGAFVDRKGILHRKVLDWPRTIPLIFGHKKAARPKPRRDCM